MKVILIIVGAILGLVVMSQRYVAGLLVGGLLGYLLAVQLQLREQLRKLQSGTAPRAEPYRAEVAAAEPEVEVEPVAEPVSVPARAEAAVPGEAQGTGPVSAPPAEAAPGTADRVVTAIRELVLGGNTAVRVGVILLFIGVAFLLKYASEHYRFPIEMRLIGTAIAAMVMLVIGWRLRTRRRAYALAVQGGAIGILYLTVFAALRLYALLPAPLALVLLVAIVGFSALLAVLEDSMALAVLGTAGGFLAPILTSTGGGSHVMLFSYFAILNTGVIAIAWFRAWRPLNVLGFVFTFVLGAAWGAQFYRPEYFATVEPFLVLFFLMYVAVPVMFATRQEPQLKGFLDATLIFGVPIVAFALQVRLVQPFEFGLAWTAVAAGGVYVALATVLFRRAPQVLRALAEATLAIGVVFVSLAIPLAFSGRWTSVTWALEGAGVLWVGVRQHRRLPRAFGMLLQIGAAVYFLREIGHPYGHTAILNADYLGRVVIAVAAVFSAWVLYRGREHVHEAERFASGAFLVWGALWWFSAGLREIFRHVGHRHELYAGLGFVALSCVAVYLLSRRLRWPPAATVAIVLWPAAWLTLPLAVFLGVSPHPLKYGGELAWPLVVLAAGWVLYRAGRDFRDAKGGATLVGLGHALLYWLLLILTTWEVGYRVSHWVSGASLWPLVTTAVVPALFVFAVLSQRAREHWPLRDNGSYYHSVAALPVVLYLLCWMLVVNLSRPANTYPLPYLPLLNALDVAVGLSLMAVLYWFMAGAAMRGRPWGADFRTVAVGAFVGSLFVWLNAILIRTLHHWAGVAWDDGAIFESVLVQSALSVFWGLLALATMWTGTRRGYRVVWLLGAGLLGVTVVKLFLIDLSNTGTVARIVSFIAVGVLMLIIGFLSPVPPRNRKEEAS